MASSKLHISGYRPLVTRRIGQDDEPMEKAQPVMPKLSAEEGWGINQVEPPPPGGYSNYNDYPTEEVILEDLWRDGAPDRPAPHRLPTPPTQPSAPFSFAFAVEFSPAQNLTLASPTRLVHADATYDFAGFFVFCHHEVQVPNLQFICGGDLVTARFAPVPIPAVLECAEEREALLELEGLLYSGLFQMAALVPDADPAEAAALHVMPRFVRAPSDAADTELLAPSAVVACLRAPQPSVLDWLIASRTPYSPTWPETSPIGEDFWDGVRRGGDGTWRIYVSGYVTSGGSASAEELGAYFEQFGMVPGSLEMKTSPTASRDGRGHFAFFTVRSPAAATELLTLSHVLYIHGEEARLRVNWATNQRDLPSSAPPPPPPLLPPPDEDVPIKIEPGTAGAALASSWSTPADDVRIKTEPGTTAAPLEPKKKISLNDYKRRQSNAAVAAADAAAAEVELRIAALEEERALAWGQLSMGKEAKWRAEIEARLDGALVISEEWPWRVDVLALDKSAASELPSHEMLHCTADPPLARWQPLLEHHTSLPAFDERKPDVAEGKQTAQPNCVLLFAPQKCSMSALKADVCQQALVLPALLSQVLWFCRAELLQKMLGLQFRDANLLRRAFVHPTLESRPERHIRATARALCRVSTRAASRTGKLRETLRLRGLRRLVQRMEKQELTAAAVLAAPSEYHNQRLEFLGDAVLEFVSTHHIFCSFPSYWEGDLTDARSSMVNNKVLGCFALRLGFDALLLHADADKDGVRFKDDVDKYLKLLADAFEAFMGALYLDSGIGACRQLLAKCVYPKCLELPLRRYWLQAANEEYSPPDKTARPAEDERGDDGAELPTGNIHKDDRDPEVLRAEMQALLDFEAACGFKFRHLGLLRQATTHPSFYMENKGAWKPPMDDDDRPMHNQRLEHLGDAALQLASSEFLFHHFPEHQEGQLSLLRATLVNNPMICDVSAACGLHHCLRYNDDTMEEAGRARRGMLSDCFEAFLGALFLDRQPLGMAAVKLFCEKMLFSLSSVLISGRRWMDPKTRLNYCLNEFNLRQPTHLRLQRTFKVIEEWGPSHEKMFVVGCYLNGQLIAKARGQSLSDAQMGAARRATEELFLNDGLEVITHNMQDSALE